MARIRRCRAQLNIRGPWGEENLQPGMQVDLDRELAPGFTIADAVRGRENEFEDISSSETVKHQPAAKLPSEE